MHFSRYVTGVGAAIAVVAGSGIAHSQAPQDLASLRNDIETLRRDYQAKIDDLEARLAKAEADAASARAAAEQAQAATAQPAVDQLAAAPEQTTQPSAQAAANAFNPGIAVALNGFATAANDDPGAAGISGFATGDEIAAAVKRDFRLASRKFHSPPTSIHSSLASSLSRSDSDDEVGLEEAYHPHHRPAAAASR